jgi:PAS domain S-box-containing protein
MPERITHEILAEIVGIAADAVICMDDFQRVTFFNTGAERIFGWSPEEIIGQRIETLIPERYRANHARQVAGFGRSGVTSRRMGERREIAGLRKSGEEFPAEAAISQVHQADGVIYAVVLRDITARKKFERRQEFLAAAGERLASAFGSGEVLEHVVNLAVPTLAEGCILEDRSDDGYRAGAVAHSDPAIAEILRGITTSGVRKPPPNHPLSDVLKNRAPVLLQTDAATRIIETSAMPAYIAAMRAMAPHSALFVPLVARSQLIGVLSLFRATRGFDVDDLGFAEDLGRLAALALDNSRLLEAVRASLRGREEMVGVVSHDLRNPVAAVKMLSGALLKDDAGGGTGRRETIALIAEAADQMDTLIRDLLDVSTLDAGKLTIAAEPAEPSELLTEALRTLQPLVHDKRISLDVQIAVGLPKVLADPERIQQALSNLVGNAIKFTPPGGKIVIAVSGDAHEVKVSIADTGIGISEEQLPKVFDRYWQSTRTDRQGAGLGLAISKGIIEAHGGSIWLESKIREGTNVQFTLPLADGSFKSRA